MTTPLRDAPFGRLADVVPQRLCDGVVTRALHGLALTVVYVELEPSVPVAEHEHANEQIGFLLTGWIDFRIGGELRRQGPGKTWIIPPWVRHGIDRTGPGGATLVEAFTPSRADYRELPELARRALAGPFIP